MKSTVLFTLLGVLLLTSYTHAGCGDADSSVDGDVSAWFKNLGCKVQKGAEDLGESVKPYADKISSTAKDFGSTVAQKYDEIKHKLTDDNVATSTPAPLYVHAPTENVPLAPLSGHIPAVAPAAGDPAVVANAPVSAATVTDHVAAPATTAAVTDA